MYAMTDSNTGELQYGHPAITVAWVNGSEDECDREHTYLWADGTYVPAVLAVHPLDAAFPHPEGTMSASEYVARTLAMASHPSAVDAPESPRESWCTWYGCMTVAAPMRCVFCGDFHPRGIPSPDVRAYA